MTKILIIGAGKGGAEMLSLISGHKTPEVVGVVDADEDAEGLKVAQSLGIPTSQDYEHFLGRSDIDLVMNLTNDNSLSGELRKLMPDVEVLGGSGAKFLWNVAVDHKRREQEKSTLAERLEASNENLSRVKEYYKNILEHSPDIIVVTGKDLKTVINFNKGAEEILGYPSSEMVGQYANRIYADENERGLILTKLAESGSVTNYETTLRTRSNRKVHTLLTISYLKDKDGKNIGTIGISKDITDIKRLENRLKETNLELESFVYTVSHDLKAPLRAIHGFSGFLMDDYLEKLEGEGKHYLIRIKEGAKMMKALIDDLLDLSTVSRSEITFKPVSSNEIVLHALKSNRFQLDEKGGQVNIGSDLPVISCDRVRVTQLFSNLINNAIKYASPQRPPTIDISCKEKELEWVFAVKDNGIGIAEEYSEKIFEIFQRLHLDEDYDGTGIGLTIIKKIALLHGGKAWVQSKPNEGSTFFVSFSKNPVKIDGFELI